MTVTAEQIRKAKAAGMHNVDIAAQVVNEVPDSKFYHMMALLEHESNGKNVYGHDAGGALSGFPGTVNEGNFAVFRWLIFTKGQTSNGVGPMQLTFKGFFTDMAQKNLKPYDVHDNMTYGLKLWNSYYRSLRNSGHSVDEAIRKAAIRYNGATAYGTRHLDLVEKWRRIVGSDDYK